MPIFITNQQDNKIEIEKFVGPLSCYVLSPTLEQTLPTILLFGEDKNKIPSKEDFSTCTCDENSHTCCVHSAKNNLISILDHFAQRNNLRTEIFVETKNPEQIQRLWHDQDLYFKKLLSPIGKTILSETDKRLYANISNTDHLVWQLGDPRNVVYTKSNKFRLEAVVTHILDNHMLGFMFDQEISYTSFNSKLTNFIDNNFYSKEDCCKVLALCQFLYSNEKNSNFEFISQLNDVDSTCINLQSMLLNYIKKIKREKLFDILSKMLSIYTDPKYLFDKEDVRFEYVNHIRKTMANISGLFLTLQGYIEEGMPENLFNDYIKEYHRTFAMNFIVRSTQKAEQVMLTFDFNQTILNLYHLHQTICSIFLDSFFVGQCLQNNTKLAFDYIGNSHVRQLKDFLISYFNYRLPVASTSNDVFGLTIDTPFDFDTIPQIE